MPIKTFICRLPEDVAGYASELFWSHVEKLSIEKCWHWKGIERNKYSFIRLPIGDIEHRLLVHRVSYMLHYGDIPHHRVIRHICHKRSCVNPHHIQSGTFADNGNDERYKSDRLILSPREVKLAKCMKECGFSFAEISKTLKVGYHIARDASNGKGAYRPLPERRIAW